MERMTFLDYAPNTKGYRFMQQDKTIFMAAQADFDEEDFPYPSNSVDQTLQSTNGILSIPFTGGGNDDNDDHPDFPQPNHPNGGNDPVDHHHNQNDGECDEGYRCLTQVNINKVVLKDRLVYQSGMETQWVVCLSKIDYVYVHITTYLIQMIKKIVLIKNSYKVVVVTMSRIFHLLNIKYNSQMRMKWNKIMIK
uniref:Uncharacterized protein n=1 Tax=Moniliophthora roreri TaxID=221103 RepID=A0A0W0FRL4_MONRR